jgi:prepilin-type processing-associated H-X9-DG protein
MSYRNTSYADIQDGASNTALFSERIKGSASDLASAEPSALLLADFLEHKTIEKSVQLCDLIPVSEQRFFSKMGQTWAVGSLSHTCYNHVESPNAKKLDCRTFAASPIDGIVAARSYHPHGVNVLKADGSAEMVSSGINLAVWWAMGTRSGAEVIATSNR